MTSRAGLGVLGQARASVVRLGLGTGTKFGTLGSGHPMEQGWILMPELRKGEGLQLGGVGEGA